MDKKEGRHSVRIIVRMTENEYEKFDALYGECNMLQVAFLASHLLWMTTFEDMEEFMEELFSMVTTYAGKVLGLQNHILKKGGDADLVILQDKDVYHAIWHHKEPLVVIKNGKIIKNDN